MSITFLGTLSDIGQALPLYAFKVPAGFPSPAADHLEHTISLDQLLNIRTPHTYLVRIDGQSMEGAGIFEGDLAVVDRSATAGHGDIVIAAIDGDPLCKRLARHGTQISLLSEHPDYPERLIGQGEELLIWGVVKFSVRTHGQKA